jgi:hypothetical protein
MVALEINLYLKEDLSCFQVGRNKMLQIVSKNEAILFIFARISNQLVRQLYSSIEFRLKKFSASLFRYQRWTSTVHIVSGRITSAINQQLLGGHSHHLILICTFGTGTTTILRYAFLKLLI